MNQTVSNNKARHLACVVDSEDMSPLATIVNPGDYPRGYDSDIPQTYVLGSWHHNHLVRNGHSLADLSDLAKVSEIFTVTDFAQVLLMNNGLWLLDNYSPSNTNFAPEDESQGLFLHQAGTLSASNQVAQSLLDRLTNTDSYLLGTDQPYQVHPVGSSVYLILNEGTMAKGVYSGYIETMVKDLLQAYYSLEQIPAVSSSSLFRIYLATLENRTKL